MRGPAELYLCAYAYAFCIDYPATGGLRYPYSCAIAQKEKQSRDAAGTPTALDPYYPEQQQRERKASKRSKSNGPTYNAERAYYERLDDLEKQKMKDEKEMAKPQYSNPMYFGHKRPPKKRPPNKMKLCRSAVYGISPGGSGQREGDGKKENLINFGVEHNALFNPNHR